MPIPVKNNTQYGGTLINQKYAPLEVNAQEMKLEGNGQEYTALFQGRINLLQGANLFPAQLNLYANNWNQIQANEMAPNALPPIVVVSSNRADWIENISKTAQELQVANYNDVNDVSALVAGPTPWYHPKRINDINRHVYIVVHLLEYKYYQSQLDATGMTVIGWSFDSQNKIFTPAQTIIASSYVGFGASRFAAIEFCKYIFNHYIIVPPPVPPPVPPARQMAWLVDDNVVYVNAFPGFVAVEQVMNQNQNQIWGMGFTGTTTNSSNKDVMNLNQHQAAPLNQLETSGLLQQCVLWNINQLNQNYLNFSPYFLNSNEDSSLSSYLSTQKDSKLRIDTNVKVVKGIPDNSSIGFISFLRTHALQNFYELEKDYPVAPTNQNQNGETTFSNYITGYVLPNVQEVIREENPIFTQAKAVEQIMAKVVANKPKWVPAEVFKPNGDNSQPTQHY